MATGYNLHTFSTVGTATLTLNAIAPTFSGRISGAGGLTLNATGGSLTLSGNNTYTGDTAITGGKVITSHVSALGNNSAISLSNTTGAQLQLNNHLSVGSVAGGGSTGGHLVLSTGTVLSTGARNTDTSFAGAISGGGGLTKTGTGTWTLTSNGSYTGATTVNAGSLVFANDAPSTASASFDGAGQLRIESVASAFTGAFSSSGWTFGNTLGSLTVGQSSNDKEVSLGDIVIAGPITVYAANLNLNGNLNTTAGGVAGDVRLKATGDIALARDKAITTSGGDVVLWANSDGQASQGMVALKERSSINTSGGHVWIGGGSGTAQFNGLTVGDGYATSGTAVVYERGSNQSAGVALLRTSIQSGNGDILIKGSSTNGYGMLTYDQTTLSSGTGQIQLDSVGSSLGLVMGTHSSVAGVSGVLSITSSNTGNQAILIKGAATAADSLGIYFEGQVNLLATQGGGITLEGQGTGANGYAMQIGNPWWNTEVNILATTGTISLLGGASGIKTYKDATRSGKLFVGAKAGTVITQSSSPIVLQADRITLQSDLYIATTGTLTVESAANAFSSAFSWPDSSNLLTVTGITGLTLGKSTNTSNLSVNASTTVNGPCAFVWREFERERTLDGHQQHDLFEWFGGGERWRFGLFDSR